MPSLSNVFDPIHSSALFNAAGNVILGLDATKTLDMEAAAAFGAGARFNGQVDFFGGGVMLHTSTPLTVNGPANFNGDMALGDSGADTIDVPGTLNLHGPLAYSFNGRVPLRPVTGPDANATFAVTDCNIIYAASVTGTRTYTVSDDGAKNGDEMLVVSGSNAASLRVAVPGGHNYEVRAAAAVSPRGAA